MCNHEPVKIFSFVWHKGHACNCICVCVQYVKKIIYISVDQKRALLPLPSGDDGRDEGVGDDAGGGSGGEDN